MPKQFKYSLPTEIYFGEGTVNLLKELLGKNQRILLVTGRSFLRKSGWLKRLQKLLKDNKVFLFDKIFANPDIKLLDTALSFAREKKVDCVVGVGGGSVLDCAKTIALLLSNRGKSLDYLDKKKKITRRAIKFIAVPTTAGSSSEVTPYSVITVPQRGLKITIAHKYNYPAVAIIDPDFLKYLPKNQIANPGIDVLCHAIEAYWNKNNNPISDFFALAAIKIVTENLAKFYKNPSSKILRNNMAKASLFAGLAFSNTRTTACHSISYPLTTIYGVPHGQACAITLPAILVYNAGVPQARIKAIMTVLRVKKLKAASLKIKKLMSSIGLSLRLKDLGLKRQDLGVILDKGFTPERMVNNPRKITKQALEKILERIY